jgi:hypothetical protein
MEIAFRNRFLSQWDKYFPGADLPLAYYYSDDATHAPYAGEAPGWRCFIGQLAKVRHGQSLCFDEKALGCGKRFVGFSKTIRADFEYFLSCGIEGKVEGERYKKTPQLVTEVYKDQVPLEPSGKFIVMKRWDKLEVDDNPEVVVFFATPDILSGLFTLINFDEPRVESVMAPFCAGCASIVYWPVLESRKPEPKAVLGMLDVSARPTVPDGRLTLAIPWRKFVAMVENMDESFLTTPSWDKVKTRIARKE